MTQATEAPPEVAARLRRLTLQFLVHSFLYYKLGETVISDEEFDHLTEELRTLRAGYPRVEMPHAASIDPLLGPEASGHQIATYPPEIITTAFKLLYAVSSSEIDFVEFVERRGYRAEL